jgi:ATP-dependent DNA ligase
MEIYEPMKTQTGDKDILNRSNLVGYLFEPCFEGTRVLVYKDKSNIAIFNKKKKDLITQFPEMLDLPAYLKTKSCILDGVLIVMNKEKIPDSKILQEREFLKDPAKVKTKSKSFPATLIVFDILEVDNSSLVNEPLKSRKLILKRLIEAGPHITIVPYTLQGKDLWKQIESQNLHGMIAKEMNSKYFPNGRNWSWLKIDNHNSSNVLIAGLIKKSDKITDIILAKFNEKTDSFRYAGRISEKSLDSKTILNIKTHSKNLVLNEPALSKEDLGSIQDKENITWLKPLLVAKIKFNEKTPKNEFLEPELVRLRNDKDAKECILE